MGITTGGSKEQQALVVCSHLLAKFINKVRCCTIGYRPTIDKHVYFGFLAMIDKLFMDCCVIHYGSPFLEAQRAFAADLAMLLLCSEDKAIALACPPLRPPILPSATAAAFLPSGVRNTSSCSSTSAVADLTFAMMLERSCIDRTWCKPPSASTVQFAQPTFSHTEVLVSPYRCKPGQLPRRSPPNAWPGPLARRHPPALPHLAQAGPHPVPPRLTRG